jgi:hypothetical protein
MSNRLLLPNPMNDLILPNHGNQSRNNRGTTTTGKSQPPTPSIASLLSSIQTLQKNAIQKECHQTLASRTPVMVVVHTGAPPPPRSILQPPLSFRTGRPMKKSSSSITTASSKKKATTTTTNNNTTSTTYTTDPQWYYMRSTPMTSELKMDVTALQNRNYMDPKRFYKSSTLSKKQLSMVQVGTVVDGGLYLNQIFDYNTKQQRAPTFLQEIMKDDKIHQYTTQTYKKMQQQQTKKSQQKRMLSSKKTKSKKAIVFKKTQSRKLK